MQFVQIETLPAGKALVDIDKLTHAVPEGEGSRMFLGAQHVAARQASASDRTSEIIRAPHVRVNEASGALRVLGTGSKGLTPRSNMA
jgi:hypothetical protein